MVGPANPDDIVFNVSVDLPIDDEIIFTGVRNNQTTGYLPTPSVTDVGQDHVTPFHNGMRWDQYYQRGLYIASVYGADEPFMLNVLGADSQCMVIGAFHVHGGSQPVLINIGGGGSAPVPTVAVQPGPARGSAEQIVPASTGTSGTGTQRAARRAARRKA